MKLFSTDPRLNGCTVFFDIPGENVAYAGDKYMCLDSSTYHILTEGIKSLLDLSIHPKKGETIYVAPDCPYASNDIRNNYTIKRNIDSATYNVFSPLSQNGRRIYAYGYGVAANKKKIVLFDRTKIFTHLDCSAIIQDPNIKKDDYEIYPYVNNRFTIFRIVKYNDAFVQLLSKSLTKPCIYYENLDISTKQELTLDNLLLVYNTGKVHSRNKDAVDNFVLQLNALNQFNWREYPGTVGMVLGNILVRERGVRNHVSNKISTFPKQVQNIIKCSRGNPFSTEKDFNMAKQFIYNILKSENIVFSSMSDLEQHLEGACISLDLYNKFFNTTVKITEKKYEGAC